MSLQVSLESWQDKASCRGPQASVFFPPLTFEPKAQRRRREARAKAICGSCLVREQCLNLSLRTGEVHGIWGGLNESERKALLEERKALLEDCR